VQTKPRAEEQVALRLRQHCRLEVFLPKLAVPKRRRGRRITAIEMLFPSYLFVHMSLEPGSWYAVKWTPGVKGIVGTGDLPVAVPDEAVRLLLDRCMAEEIIAWRPAYPVGAHVRITHGPFAGLVGILERPATRQERVRVLLHLLGGPVPVEVEVADLEQVS
jgi:transcription antitermination factor NusG